MSILSTSFLEKYKGRQPDWGFNGLGYIVYKRTYARLKSDGSTEEWNETVQRCIEGAQDIGADYTVEEAERLYDHMFNLRCNMAGRMLWQLGTETVKKFGLPSLCNCWFINIDSPEAFCFLFEHLMLGGGVGFSIKREHVHQLPKVKANITIEHKQTKDADFIVPDSREGWVELARRVFLSAFVTGKSFSYSTILIRGAGELIRGFGGTASGPAVLIDGIQNIVKIINSRVGKRLRSIDALDICNIFGSIVVAGNVRRSAEIAIGDADDTLFLNAKRWDLGNVPNWRAMSNNTVDADDFSYLTRQFWAGYAGDGEPYGVFNRSLCKSHGRLIDGPMTDSDLYVADSDPAEGCNPCAEANLEHGEPCDLAEIYMNRVRSLEEMIDCALLLYKTQKAILRLPSISDWTNNVVKKNMRIGLGVTGIYNDVSKVAWLDPCYRALAKFDREWSKHKGWNESIKRTVIKPSGTLSLLAGSTPGAHPEYDRYYIRRIRMSSSDPLIKVCRNLGCHVEYVEKFDGTIDHSTCVVSFPVEADQKTTIAPQITPIDQLEMQKTLQTYWADQSVSITVYYNKGQLPEIQAWLEANYKESVKTVSFLLHSGHGFKQAPYESITAETYTKMKSAMKPLSSVIEKVTELSAVDDSAECAGGVCPIR